MRLVDFYDRVEAHPSLDGVGFVRVGGEAGPAAVVRHRPTGILTRVGLDALARMDWPELEAVLTAAREPEVLQHMARVVGYYSRTSNWNASKIGELRDRRRGNYAISEKAGESP